MNAISSICIPRIDSAFNAEFIADVFDRNGIAKVNKVLIEPYKSDNRAYIGIKSWYDNEVAYNFIDRLRNPNREARIVYNEDNWWSVYINKHPTKLAYKKRLLTVFEYQPDDYHSTFVVNESQDDISISATPNENALECVQIDAEKTALLRNIVADFKNYSYYDESIDFDSYLYEVMDARERWFANLGLFENIV